MSGTRKPVLLYVLSALILLEGLALAGATIYLVIEIFAGASKYVATAVAYAVTAGVFAALVLVVGRFALQGRPWIRGATVCIGVLQLLLAYSILIAGSVVFGIVLAVPAVALLVLVFTPPVLRATMRPDREREDRTF